MRPNLRVNSFYRKKLQKNAIILHFYIHNMNINFKTFLKTYKMTNAETL